MMYVFVQAASTLKCPTFCILHFHSMTETTADSRHKVSTECRVHE